MYSDFFAYQTANNMAISLLNALSSVFIFSLMFFGCKERVQTLKFESRLLTVKN